MSDQRVFKYGMVTFQDGSTMDVPVISGSVNGWVYKPDMLRTKQEIASGRNRAWPRGSGFASAEEWMQDYIERQFSSRNWEYPAAVEKIIEEPDVGIRYNTDGLSVSWFTDLWGWVTLSLSVTDPSKNTYGQSKAPEGPRTLVYKLILHEIGLWCLNEEITRVSKSWAGAETDEITVERTLELANVRGAVVAWMENPMAQTIPRLQHHYTKSLGDLVSPPDLTHLKFEGANAPQNIEESIVTNSAGKIKFYKAGEIQKILKKDVAWDELRSLFDAFRFLGYGLRVHTGYSSGSEDIVHSISIEVPPEVGVNNELGHTVIIDANRGNISFECGYMEDEQRWIKRQTRIAKDEMEQLEEDLYVEYEIPVE
jgi:hypothetical protein